MKFPISVCIITKNEEKNIERCLQSVKWADEIIVIDSGSTDKTVEICERFGCNIIETEWLGFGKTKRLAVNSASHNWILSLDADEVISENLKNEILDIIKNNMNKYVYKIKFNTFYLGRMIKHSGWQNDYHSRLFDKRFANYNENTVHESILSKLPKKKLKYPIYHYSYPDLETHLKKIKLYTRLAAKNLFENGKKSTPFVACIRGLANFLKMYIFQLGILDGKEGLILAVNSSYYVFLKHIRLWELWKNG